MADKIPAVSGKKSRAKTGPPVLVVLDPKDSTGIEINFTEVEELKLWVLNNLNFLYTEDGNAWVRGYVDFEGCLTEPEIIVVNGVKDRIHLTLGKAPKSVHFSCVPPGEKERKRRFEDFGFEGSILENEDKTVVRPYPEDLPEGYKTFNIDRFQNGIRVLKIPSKNVKYLSGKTCLRYWESLVYQCGKNGIFSKLKSKEQSGDPWTSKEEEELKNALNEIIGVHSATIKQTKNGNEFVPMGIETLPPRDDGLFAFGKSEDVQKHEGSGKAVYLKEKKPKESQDICAHVNLYKVPPSVIIRPAGRIFSRFNLYDLKKMAHLFTKSKKLHERDDEALLKEVEDYLTGLSGFSSEEKKELLRQFHICTGDSESTCIMLAVTNALENWRKALSSYHADAMADYRRQERDKLVEKGFSSRYMISAKPFYFATGCDAYSSHIVPKHIYFQIKEWWEEHLLDYQRKEIATEVDRIEIHGYSSKKGSESMNNRLRDDRAWKTAKSLELILKKQIKDREIILVDMSTLKALREIETLIERGRTSSREQPKHPENKKKILPILHYGELLEYYPNWRMFKGEGTYVMDLIVDTTMDVREPLKEITDNPEDRAVLVIFKRAIPEKVNQIVKSVVVTNNAGPIFNYQVIFSHKIGVDTRSCVYVCPGVFAN